MCRDDDDDNENCVIMPGEVYLTVESRDRVGL